MTNDRKRPSARHRDVCEYLESLPVGTHTIVVDAAPEFNKRPPSRADAFMVSLTLNKVVWICRDQRNT